MLNDGSTGVDKNWVCGFKTIRLLLDLWVFYTRLHFAAISGLELRFSFPIVHGTQTERTAAVLGPWFTKKKKQTVLQ